ncbi:hypothetical protein TNCV_258461 [Trichonephila clavipes]|uniref:Uncharacterized protein n=1 Tax=Trichonephila clavipes TaxID=2585209 RepID=A0A8X6S3F2_TRICX|nr:hypothetical protein TNCV_258461 [Trichonephila clavipes]
MTVGNLTEGRCLIERELQILESIDSNEEQIFSNKTRNQKIITKVRENFESRGSPVAKVTDSWSACHEFEPCATEDQPCRGADAL